ncbi:hypothetical protein PPYR_09924 [Photinus pyralis]|nr:sodium-coupled monocarboxylate transporter 2-like isoform X3 [Photinus pyralis]XP_031348603.1 sodium-coupled monocarboxylate transporter 2-like isoform X3 [Photinus pyralis]KAB0795863.1 hypothetical protein PPYR_09924 [Photinus pyralis]
MMVFSIMIMGIINNYVYLPVFYELQLKNPVDYLAIRFDEGTRRVASIFNSIGLCLSLPLIIYVPSLALTQVSGVNLNVIASVMFLICVSYATIVRMGTTEWLNAFQLAITVFALVIVLFMGIVSVGGVSRVWQKSMEGNRLEFFNMDLNPMIRCTFWSVIIGNTFSWLGFVAVNPSGVQRFVSFSSISDARRVLVIFVVLAILAKLVSCFSGLIMFAKYFYCDPLSMGYMTHASEILPYFVLEVASKCPGLSGLFIAGLFSTALNTMSVALSKIATDTFDDIIAPCRTREFSKKDANYIIISIIIATSMISVAAVQIIGRLGSLLELFQCAYGITGGPVLGLFTLGVLFPVANKKGALTGALVSVLVMSSIIVQHQVDIWNKSLVYNTKEMRTYGCDIYSFLSINTNSSANELRSVEHEEAFSLAKISFHYYYFIGTLITVIIGLVVSWITRKEKDSIKNPYIFSPIIHKFLRPVYVPI